MHAQRSSTVWLAATACGLLLGCGEQPPPQRPTGTPPPPTVGATAASTVGTPSSAASAAAPSASAQLAPSFPPGVSTVNPTAKFLRPRLPINCPVGSECAKAYLKKVEREANERIHWLFRALKKAQEVGLTPLASDTEFRNKFGDAYYDSYYGIGIQAQVRPDVPPLFQSDRHPYVPELFARRSYFVGDKGFGDFLLHEYAFDRLAIVVFEGVNEVLVRLPGQGKALVPMSPVARVAEVRRFAEKLLADPWRTAQWHERGGGGETAGIAYTTEPIASLQGASVGRVRMDAGVWDDDLYYVYYRTRDEQRGLRRKHIRWFDKGEKGK